MWRGGSVLEDSNTGSGVTSRTLLLQVYLGQVRAQHWGSGRDKQLRVGPVMFPAVTFYPQIRTRRNKE